MPRRYSKRARPFVAAKYSGWRLLRAGEGAVRETAASGRKVTDSLCWILLFHPVHGNLLPEPSTGRRVQPKLVGRDCRRVEAGAGRD